jgi:hypothetical protein
MPKPRTVRLVQIAELLGVSKQRAHQLAADDGFPLRSLRKPKDDCGIGARSRRGRSAGEARSLALAHELHAVGLAGVHERLQDLGILCRRFGVELVQRLTIRVTTTRPSSSG